MFTQKISMDCTREQYDKYLWDELSEMGYKEAALGETFNGAIVNNFGGRQCEITNCIKTDVHLHSRTYLGTFNAPLFLALAGMTDDARGSYGEYWTSLVTSRNFTKGKLYKQVGMREVWAEVIDDNGDKQILGGINYGFMRKSTKEEIMQKFSEKQFKAGDYLILRKYTGGRLIGILSGDLKKGNNGFPVFAGLGFINKLYINYLFGYQEGDLVTHSTDAEKRELDEALAKEGKYFDKEKLKIAPIKERLLFNLTEETAQELQRVLSNITDYHIGSLSERIEEHYAILMLKSKGYKILQKKETWEEI